MTKKAIVLSTDEKIIVLPLQKDECTTCTAGCTKNSTQLEVSNPAHLEVKKGSVVIISSSYKTQALQALFALLVPLFAAVTGYFIASPVASLFGKTAKDGLKALFVLIMLFLSAAIVYIISRKHSLPGKVQIVEVQ